jgi:hypothetical protein
MQLGAYRTQTRGEQQLDAPARELLGSSGQAGTLFLQGESGTDFVLAPRLKERAHLGIGDVVCKRVAAPVVPEPRPRHRQTQAVVAPDQHALRAVRERDPRVDTRQGELPLQDIFLQGRVF